MEKLIKGTEEAWESGELGQSEEHVRKSTLDPLQLDVSLGLKAISIRMQESLIDDLKLIAEIHGLGYQPLIKQVLKRFVEAEKKLLLKEKAAELAVANEQNAESDVAYG